MQYIEKLETPPVEWGFWFTTATGNRSYNYGADYGSLTNLVFAKQKLIEEQHGLCAYCQQTITGQTSSIEHVIPKEFNVELSTCYYNLVVVCKNPPKDENGKLHCDKEKQSKLITPFIFASNSDVTWATNNSYFAAGADGMLRPKERLSRDHEIQAEAFISILNLNHSTLKGNRNEVFNGIFEVYRAIPNNQKDSFWQSQFNSVLQNKSRAFRQFLLILIAGKIGIN